MTAEEARLLVDYDAWANHRLLDACAALNEEQFTRDLGSSFRSVRDTLAHTLGGQWLWLERWHGRSPTGLPASSEFPTVDGLRSRWAEIERDLAGFAAGLTAESLAKPVAYRTTDGKSYTQPLWQQLQHLMNHGTYHRGQVTTLLRQLGARPVATDLIVFYRERR
jgi:uncharacterized damage-inducible protein DinB